jgi:hypothetical protein
MHKLAMYPFGRVLDHTGTHHVQVDIDESSQRVQG